MCADSLLAVVAKDYLDAKGMAVPDQLSLVGIDEYDGSLIRGIDTYDFQVGQMGYLAAHCMIGDIPIKRNRKGIVEWPGTMVERGSVRRAK